MGDLVDGVGEIFGVSSQASDTRSAGSRQQAAIEAKNRAAQRRIFDAQIARQQPFVDVGTSAVPLLSEAISNRGIDPGQLPSTQIQGQLISDFLGESSPGFITDRAISDLSAIEAEKNKSRLSDLVNVGLGGVGSSAGSGLNIASNVGSSLMTSGNIESQALQQSAIDRANNRNQLISSLGGFPSLFASGSQGGTGSFNPFITEKNPLGLTSGQGL